MNLLATSNTGKASGGSAQRSGDYFAEQFVDRCGHALPLPSGVAQVSKPAVSQASSLQAARNAKGPLPRPFAPSRRHSHSGFSLLEILVAVGLLAVIIVGLLSMFYQTEKAFRLGTRQVDVLETGRAVMDLLTRELQEINGVNDTRIVNLYAVENFAPVIQPRPSFTPGVPEGKPLVNHLQDYYFLTHSNDLWTGIGYFLEPVGNGGVGSLHRFSTNLPNVFPGDLENLYLAYSNALFAAPTNWSRVADNIIHLRLVPYDRDGIPYYFGPFTGMVAVRATNLNDMKFGFPFVYPTNRAEMLPAFVDIELGILEPRALERYKSLTDPKQAEEYLTNHVDKVHFFRQRVTVRTRQ